MKKNTDDSQWYMYLPWIPCIIALCFLWGYIIMITIDSANGFTEFAVAIIGGIAALLAALIAGAVALWGQWRQLKRDGKTIDAIDSKTGGTDKMVSGIDPKVDRIQLSIDNISPEIARIEDRTAKIDFIAEEARYYQKSRQDVSKNVVSQDAMQSYINSLYVENARLNQLCGAYQEQVVTLFKSNAELERKNNELVQKLQTFEKSRDDFDEELSL